MRHYLNFISKSYSISVIRPLLEEIRRQLKDESLIFAPEKALNLTDVTGLRIALDCSLREPQEFAAKRRETLAQIHPYYDPASSRRVLDAVDQVLDSNLSKRLKRKPLNLYRKFRICPQLRGWLNS